MYISIDGDNIGSALEKLVILQKTDELRNFSRDVFSFFEAIKKELLNCEAEVIFHGGDSILAKIAIEHIDSVALLEKIFTGVLYRERCKISISVGLGSSILEAYIALKAAKSSGKSCWIKYPELHNPHKF
jgi:GTP cyclohydrolase III